MKKSITILSSITFAGALFASQYLPQNETLNFANGEPIGLSGDVSIHYQNSSIKAWATGYENYNVGYAVDAQWQTPEKAIGAVQADNFDVVVLGNGGSITMTFSSGIKNGTGFDFAVFENSNIVADEGSPAGMGFWELAYVEVSSDGNHFVRFPNFYLGGATISAYGQHAGSLIYNLASKYMVDYGHCFDLGELEYAYNYITSSDCEFTEEYCNDFLANYQYLDLDNVAYVRVIDIIGDGSCYGSDGYEIYDPHLTYGSGGFDLQGIAVMNIASTSSVPEPSTYAIILGVIALSFAIFRKRK